MNWAWKIVVVYSAFVVMTLSMAFFFMRQKVDLVADDLVGTVRQAEE